MLITEELVDQEFLDSHCLGYDQATMPEGDVITALPEYHPTWGNPDMAVVMPFPGLPGHRRGGWKAVFLQRLQAARPIGVNKSMRIKKRLPIPFDFRYNSR